jgi:hypothetical protein
LCEGGLSCFALFGNVNIEMTLAQPKSIIGNLLDLHDGEVALPRFIIKNDNGLFVDLTRLEFVADLETAVDRFFASEAYFLALDYELFIQLLFSVDPSEAGKPKNADEASSMIRFAADIVAFTPERRALYKGVKIGDGVAEYLFEPVCLESVEDEPVYGEDEDGANVVVGFQRKISSQPASLDFDEFVADMWLKGIHFGLDADVVRTAIKTGVTERVIVARRLNAIPGTAAGIKELAEEIHRDDAPTTLPDGRVNLRQFKNRFPQIGKGVRLIKKIPRVPGINGYEISGNLIEPPAPKDFDLASLSGPGTAVEIDKDGEFIVSRQDGFLNLDPLTNQIWITEKIVNREGVSVKTTGDLVLTGDEYEEHGEVQENRVVDGHSIVMHANVFGTIISRGGNILFKSNLIGGSATNREGDITVEGVASGSVVQTKNGAIHIKRAENCVLIGTRVSVEHASNCDILADEVHIDDAEGCAIAAKNITLISASPRKQSEMLVFVPLPDLAEFDLKIRAVKDKIEEIEQLINKNSLAIESATSQPDVKKYLLVAARLKSGEIILSPEQKTSMQRLATTAHPALRLATRINAETRLAAAEKLGQEERLELLIKRRKAAENGARCSIAKIAGEILVRALKITPENEAALHELPPKKLKAALHSSSMNGERIYAGRNGSLDWKFEAKPTGEAP